MSKERLLASWVPTIEAKTRYYLTTRDLATLSYEHHPVRQGKKPIRLYNPKDLRQLAEKKLGKEEFQARLIRRKLKKRGCRPNKFFLDDKEKGVKKARESKTVQQFPQNVEEAAESVEGLCTLIKKCSKAQLQQLIALTGQKNPSFISAIDAVKDVALLTRSKFKLLEPTLAKLLSNGNNCSKTSCDEFSVWSQKSCEGLSNGSQKFCADLSNGLQESCEEDMVEKQANEIEQRELNMTLEGKWMLKVAALPHKKEEEGMLEITFYGSGFNAGGEIYFQSSDVSGDIEGFKKSSSVEHKDMLFETRSRNCDKWYTGALLVSISTDVEGLVVSGSFWPGYKEQGITNTFQFTGRKPDAEDVGK